MQLTKSGRITLKKALYVTPERRLCKSAGIRDRNSKEEEGKVKDDQIVWAEERARSRRTEIKVPQHPSERKKDCSIRRRGSNSEVCQF